MRFNPKTAAALIAVSGSLLVPASSQAIVNGSIDGTLHPYVGAITVNYGGAQVLACSGALISPTVLVTAAHCTAQLQQLGYSQADVSFDPDVGNGTDVTCGLTDCFVAPARNSLHTGTLHTDPDFTGNVTGVDSHDIAVITFDTPVKGIAPAPLPSAGELDTMSAAGGLGSQSFTNVGYGWHAIVDSNTQNWTGLLDGRRRYATSGFQSLTTSDLKLTENPAQGYGGVCSHDSGGPTLLQDGTVVALLSNIQSSRCASAFYEYRLDTDSARAFLANYVTLP